MKQWHITPAHPSHIAPVAAHMREADRREVWASHRHTPQDALEASLAASDLAWTCFVDDAPAFMWGAARAGSLITRRGAPWLLGTDALYAVRRDFVRLSPEYVAAMQKRFARLENFVHAGNRLSIHWLERLGFTLLREPVRMNNEPFYRFYRERA